MLQLQSQIPPVVIPCNSHEESKWSTAEPRVWPLESLLPTAKPDPETTQLDFQHMVEFISVALLEPTGGCFVIKTKSRCVSRDSITQGFVG